MTITKKFITKITAVLVVIFAFSSCDDDLNSIGSSIVGEVNFDSDVFSGTEIRIKNRITEAVQTNGSS